MARTRHTARRNAFAALEGVERRLQSLARHDFGVDGVPEIVTELALLELAGQLRRAREVLARPIRRNADRRT